ncbi:hypothetical protein PF004_g16285 [Phytophthora fragariae]|uniref:Uncharacterized protein n=1 Tax=Phytophthora fragariae TaxID=53985 RepID=A0A6G0NIV1_9STRA|nr:hypothetical protein PF003_g30296 [Phytophthora fragariae]KAE9210071.1 hypothetical protein PF004_g16285 [Phytophthora fragariae]
MIHGLKWLHNASAPVIEARNVCFLEAMEVERDANDEKFGFLVLHSLRWCRVCGIAVCSKCRVIGFLEVEYAVVADYFMESFWESEPQAEVATLFTIPLQWAGPLKEPIAAFCDWKQHRPGPVAAQNWNSSLN